MNKIDCAVSSNATRKASKIEDQHYKVEIAHKNPTKSKKKKSLLDLTATGWFGTAPSGFSVIPAEADGRTLDGIFYIIPAS